MSKYKPSIIIFILFLVAVLMLPSNPVENLPGQDNGVFLYAGQRLLAGDTPYVDFWDHKGPLIFYVNALGLLLGAGSRWGVWLLEYVFLFFAAVGLYEISRLQKWNTVSSSLVLLLWYFFMKRVGSYYHFGDANYIESYGLLFNVWGCVFWLQALNVDKKNSNFLYFLVGVTAGLSFSLRPNNIAAHISLVLVELLAGLWNKNLFEHLRRVFFVALGGLFVVSIFMVLFLKLGAFSQLVDSVFFYNVFYSAKNASAASMVGVLKFGLMKFYWIPFLAFIGIVANYLCQTFNSTLRFSPKWTFVFFLLIWGLLEMVFSSLSGRALLHYFINWTPLVSLMSVYVIVSFFQSDWFLRFINMQIREVGRWIFVVLSVAFLLFNFPVLAGGWNVFTYIWYNQKLEPERSLIEFIRSTTISDDEVLVWGNDVWINFMTNRQSPSKYAYQYALFMPGYTNREKVFSFLQDISTCPPKYIIEPVVDTDEILPLSQSRRLHMGNSVMATPDGMPQVYAFFDNNYELLHEINGVNIFSWTGNYDRDKNCSNR